MPPDPVPTEVKRFVSEYISAADQLDILLLLHARRDESLTATDVSKAVFTVPTSATLRLEQLAMLGLVASSGGQDPTYTYRPETPAKAAAVDALASAYRVNRVGVIQLVFEKSADPLKSFADAFRLKKEGQ